MMELFYNCTRSKSVLNVLGPIAQKIIDLKQNHQGVVCEPEVIIYLIKQCEALKIASFNLKNQLTAEAQKIGDNSFLREINNLHLPFMLCIDGLANATRDLYRGDDTDVKENDDVWEELITYSEDLLGSMIKIMLSWDLALLRRVHRALDVFLVAVGTVQNAPFEQLHNVFQDIVRTSKDCLLLIEERMNNICLKSQRDALHIYALQLRKTLSLLANVATNSARHPFCKDAKICCNFVIDRIKDLVENIRKETDLGSQNYINQEPGKYIHTLNNLFGMITLKPGELGPTKLPLLKYIKSPIELVLQHCVGVALCLSPESYSSIMTACESVLQQLKVLSKLENEDRPRTSDVDVVLDVIVDVLEILEIKVNAMLLKLVVHTFTEPFLSLESLVHELESEDTEEGADESDRESRIESKLTAFEEDVDKYYQIAGFVIACIADTSRVREIESNLGMLDWLESCIISAARKASADRISHLHVRTIRTFIKPWMDEVLSLKTNIYLMVEPDALLPVTKHEIHTIWSELRGHMEGGKEDWFKERVRRVRAMAQQLLRLNEDNPYLKEDQAAQIAKGLCQVRMYEAKVLSSNFDDEVNRSFIKRLQYLLTIISRVASSFSRDSFTSDNERDFYGFREYEEGYTAAKRQFCESDAAKNDSLMLSNISDLPKDLSDECVVESPVNRSEFADRKSSSQNSATGALVEEDAQISFHGQKAIRLVRRNSRAKSNRNLASIKFDMKNVCADEVRAERCSDNVSIDITKFLLSRSTNTFRNSTRASKRNFSLKVKEIDLDIGEVIKINRMEDRKNALAMTILAASSDWGPSDFCETTEDKSRTHYLESVRRPYMVYETFAGFNTKKQYRIEELKPLFPMDTSLEGLQLTKDSTNAKDLKQSNEEDLAVNSKNSSMVVDGKLQVASEQSQTMDSDPVLRTTLSNSDLVSCIATPSSLEVDTPQRLEDLQSVRNKLSSLKFVLCM